ncbi:hypothetical protein NL50_10485 [Clostridium acetobutylicum]|nr:hypothetical protein NL50_10485 [Clostridium acetobutylicum]
MKSANGIVIDVATNDELIEVKNSTTSIHLEQLDKYANKTNKNFFNYSSKKVIIYIDKPMDISNNNTVKLIEKIKNKGITVVNSLDELKGELK